MKHDLLDEVHQIVYGCQKFLPQFITFWLHIWDNNVVCYIQVF